MELVCRLMVLSKSHPLYAMDMCHSTMGVHQLMYAGTMDCCTCPMTLLHPSHGPQLQVHGTKHLTFSAYHGSVP